MLASSPLAATPTVAPLGRPGPRRPGVRRPGVTERILVTAVIFINMFGTPASWFTRNTGSASGPTDDHLLSYGSLVIIVILGLGLVGAGDAVLRVVTAEPLMSFYFLVVGVSPLWSDRPGESLAGAVNLLAMIGLGVVLLVRFPPREIFQLVAFAFTLGIVMDLYWVLAMGSLGRNGGGHWDGLATQKNALGNHGLLAVMVFIIAARTFRRLRFPFYLLTGLAIVLTFGSQSKTSLGAGLITAASFVVFVAYRARRTLVGAVTTALVTGITVSALLVTANLEAVVGRFGKDVTFTGRTPLWTEVLRAIGREPWRGFGYDGYFGGPLSESHLISAYAGFDWGPDHAHNALLESALHVGIPLTVVYLAFNLRALARATDHIRWVRGPLGLFPLVYLTMMTMTSITESGIFTQRFGVTLYVVAVVMARVGVEEARTVGAVRLDQARSRSRQGPAIDLGDHHRADDETTRPLATAGHR